MAIVSLLRLPMTEREGWAFVFEHDMAHRKKPPRTPHVFDPMQNANRPGSKWHLDHQQAHNRMAMGPPLRFNPDLRDSNLFNPRQKAWWVHMNHWAHYIHQLD